jgi:CheY-like chemotaxis protein
MSDKHVLIVDDAPDILFLLTHSVKRLGPDFKVSTAMDGVEALELIQQRQFDLVITDYMMPGMTGLELAQEIRQRSPDTQVLLMSAYDTIALREQVETMKLGGYLGKPFSVPDILGMVQRIVAQTRQTVSQEPAKSPVRSQTVFEQLKLLHNQTGSQCVLLLNSDGQPLQMVGQVDRSKVSRLAMFVAANFLTVSELATLLDDNSSVFKSIYHEGSKYSIYAYDINGEFLLAVLFGSVSKPGTVWFYTKQAATNLAPLLGQRGAPEVLDDKTTTVAEEFDDLLGDKTNGHG